MRLKALRFPSLKEAVLHYTPKGLKKRECWYWRGAYHPKGYGWFRHANKNRLAHRAAWEVHHGAPPDKDLCVCHKCDNRGCVNPSHLFLGTHQDNVDDMMKKGRGNWAKGEKSGNSSLSEKDVAKIRELYSKGKVQGALAKQFGVNISTVGSIIRRETWSHI